MFSSPLAWRLCGSSLSLCWSYWSYRGRAPRPSRLHSTCVVLTWSTPFTWSVGTEASSTTPRETWTLCWVRPPPEQLHPLTSAGILTHFHSSAKNVYWRFIVRLCRQVSSLRRRAERRREAITRWPSTPSRTRWRWWWSEASWSSAATDPATSSTCRTTVTEQCLATLWLALPSLATLCFLAN